MVMKIFRKRIIWWILAIGFCSLIFYATSSPSFTGNSTSNVLGSIIELFFNSLGITINPYIIIDPINFIFRKSGHFIFFGLLAVFFRLALGNTNRPYLYAWVITTIYATFDEYHQSLVPNRTASIMDVGLDSFGAFIALLLLKRNSEKIHRIFLRWKKQ
jgi:VanZ family protein